MNVFYDPEEQIWFHTKKNKKFTMGIEKILIPFRSAPPPSSLSFHFLLKDGEHLGPLIGILAEREEKKKIIGNKQLFKKLQREILVLGGLTVVFSPEDIGEKVEGLLYLPSKNWWINVVIPFPHIIYNRIPSRKGEQSKKYVHAKETLTKKGCSLFNPCFINKYELYSILKRDEWLNHVLPDTILIKKASVLKKFIDKHVSLYMKPADSAMGKGIFKLSKDVDDSILLENYNKRVRFQNFDAFWKKLHVALATKEYIAQKEIAPLLFEGRRFDFRVLVHYSGNGYEITGIGVRQSGNQSITTHVPKGGRLLPSRKMIRPKDELFIEEVARRCGELLSKKLGFFGEFSIDAGITSEGKYVIYEVNSKPMSFDEQEIEMKRIKKLVELFHHLFIKH